MPPFISNTVYSCCGSRTGSMRSSKAFSALKTAVFAPMPRARVRIAVMAKPGDLPNWRTPKRIS